MFTGLWFYSAFVSFSLKDSGKKANHIVLIEKSHYEENTGKIIDV